MELISIDTTGPYPKSLGGSRCVIMFEDSASHLQRPYGTRDKCTPAIIAAVKYFVADIVVPGALRMDNGLQYTSQTFTKYCDGLGVRRGLTSPHTPQQDGPVESALARTMKRAPKLKKIKSTFLFPVESALASTMKAGLGSTTGGQQYLPGRAS